MVNVYNQLQEAQTRLQSAQAAERERIERETAAQREIAKAQTDIEQLAKAARGEDFERARATSDLFVAQVIEANDRVIALLDAGDVRTAITEKDRAARLHKQHRDLVMAAMATVNIDIQAAYNAPVTDGVHTQFAAHAAGRSAAAAYEDRLKHIYPIAYAVLAWISTSPDPITRQIRRGLAFCLWGEDALTWNPSAGYNPLTVYRRDINQRNNQY